MQSRFGSIPLAERVKDSAFCDMVVIYNHMFVVSDFAPNTQTSSWGPLVIRKKFKAKCEEMIMRWIKVIRNLVKTKE